MKPTLDAKARIANLATIASLTALYNYAVINPKPKNDTLDEAYFKQAGSTEPGLGKRSQAFNTAAIHRQIGGGTTSNHFIFQ